MEDYIYSILVLPNINATLCVINNKYIAIKSQIEINYVTNLFISQPAGVNYAFSGIHYIYIYTYIYIAVQCSAKLNFVSNQSLIGKFA